MRWARWWLVFGALACGGGDGDDGGDSGATEEVNDEPVDYDEMNQYEKFAYMGTDVQPVMTELFQAFDPDRYADFSCATCHPQGSEDGTYAMPDPGLMPLRDEDFPYTSDIGRFMNEEVLPANQDLLGPTDGGPCLKCHPLEQ